MKATGHEDHRLERPAGQKAPQARKHHRPESHTGQKACRLGGLKHWRRASKGEPQAGAALFLSKALLVRDSSCQGFFLSGALFAVVRRSLQFVEGSVPPVTSLSSIHDWQLRKRALSRKQAAAARPPNSEIFCLSCTPFGPRLCPVWSTSLARAAIQENHECRERELLGTSPKRHRQKMVIAPVAPAAGL